VVGREDIVGSSDYRARHVDSMVSWLDFTVLEEGASLTAIKRCIGLRSPSAAPLLLFSIYPGFCRDRDTNSIVSFIVSSLIGREPNSNLHLSRPFAFKTRSRWYFHLHNCRSALLVLLSMTRWCVTHSAAFGFWVYLWHSWEHFKVGLSQEISATEKTK
jgi:hypothetical protein